MGHIAKLGHIWLYYSQIGLLGWKWPKLGIISYVKWPFLAIYMTWGHHDRIRERNLNMTILWAGRNFWARNFEISLYPENFWYLKVPKEGLYMIRITWRIILINQNHFLTTIWNQNDLFRNFGQFWLNFHRLRFSLPEGARARQYTQNDRKEHLCRKVKK